MTITPASLQRALLAWYDAHRRDLPWRASTDPYRVWVSEIMLQQTRVDVVVSYYNRWLATFPDLDTLATAYLHDVLKHWEGLGYYSRARNLHSAARLVREQYSSRVPDTYDALRKLPGIGEYTAGAIASIAYNQKHPAVDGNVRRVLSRIFDIPAPDTSAVRDIAKNLIDPERPGDFNQALMELGASVCTSAKPLCDACPVLASCRAYANGTVHERPGRKIRKPVPTEHVNTLICMEEDRVRLQQRPRNGLLGGLWEFPECTDLPVGSRSLGQATHVFSHKRIVYHAHLCSPLECPDVAGQWVPLCDLALYPLSIAQRKVERLLRNALEKLEASNA